METLKNSWELRLRQLLISLKICLRIHNLRITFVWHIGDILIIFLFYVTILQSLFLQILETNFNRFEFFLETEAFE